MRWNMLRCRSLQAAAVVFLCSSTWAVNKCTAPSGRVSYQDAPCAGQGEALELRPASGTASAQEKSAPTPKDWKAKSAQADTRLAIQAAIMRREAVVGMTFAQLEQAMGLPNRINTGEYKSGSTQQRIYERGSTTWYVYTESGLVTALQTSVMPRSKAALRRCPNPVEIAAAETSASSITLSDAERVERLKQIGEMRNCGN